MSVKDVQLLWCTFPAENVTLSDSRAVATRVFPTHFLPVLGTTGIELHKGRHYWEVERLAAFPLLGICKLNLHPTATFDTLKGNTFSWMITTNYGALHGRRSDLKVERVDMPSVTVLACCWISMTAPFFSSKMAHSTAQAFQRAV
jgi:hypothetical protein